MQNSKFKCLECSLSFTDNISLIEHRNSPQHHKKLLKTSSKLPDSSPFFAQRMDDLEVVRRKLQALAEEKKKKKARSKKLADSSSLDQKIKDRINKRRLDGEGGSRIFSKDD